jgi:hypothetical protein
VVVALLNNEPVCKRLCKSGHSKAEVMLMNLCQSGKYTDDLFAISQTAEATRVMGVLDQINEGWGGERCVRPVSRLIPNVVRCEG